jgi:hypothetical protein
VTPGKWRHIAVVVNRTSGNAQFFVDGINRTVGSSTLTNFPNQTNLFLGRFGDANFFFQGMIDEARIENTARSTNWFWANWMMTVSNAMFMRYSAPLPQRPELTGWVSPGTFSVEWPGFCTGYSLYTATNLTLPEWTLATNDAFLVSDRWRVTLPASQTDPQFFRLGR